MEPNIRIVMRLKGKKDFNVTMSKGDRVLDLKQKVMEITNFLPEQQRLVFAGRVLNDELSLSFYKIINGSSIYIVPKKLEKNTIKNPKLIIAHAKSLLSEVSTANKTRASQIHEELREIITDPVLNAFIPLSNEAANVIEEARQELEYQAEEASEENTRCIAQQADTALNQIEGSYDGLRVLQQLYDDDDSNDGESKSGLYKTIDEEEEDELSDDYCDDGLLTDAVSYDEPTLIPKKPERISELPLPMMRNQSIQSTLPFILPTGEAFNYELSNDDFWCENDFKKYVMQKYSQQVAILKKMGFDDEQNIIQALSETNGNVQLASQILRNHIFFQC